MAPRSSPAASAHPPAVDSLIEYYYAQGLTDGLPVVPPTRESIAAMLAGGGLKPDQPLATFAPQNKTVTAEKAAINAVLAGCLPEYMPVVAAALKAFCEPAFNGIGPATTTGSTAMTLIVNGPLAGRLGINARDNVLGHGFRANATIGRALRLMLMNVFEFRPGRNDRSTLGNPGRYSFCFAENEAESPWEPLHVERGFAAEQSTVTLFATIGQTTIRISDDKDPAPSLALIADGMSFLGSHNILGQGEFLVVFAGEMTRRCAEQGFGKSEVKKRLYEQARRSVADLKRTGRIREPLAPGDESAWRHVVKQPEDIILVAAGGAVGFHAACLPGWGLENPIRSVTVPIAVPGG